MISMIAGTKKNKKEFLNYYNKDTNDFIKIFGKNYIEDRKNS